MSMVQGARDIRRISPDGVAGREQSGVAYSHCRQSPAIASVITLSWT